MDDVKRARELQSTAVQRELTESEIHEAYALVERLSEKGHLHGAAWAHDAISRTYKRRKKNKTHHLALRSLERTAADILRRAGNRPVRLDMSHAPRNATLSSFEDKKSK